MLPGQLDLLTWSPRARRGDPQTSQEAGARVDQFLSKHCREILDALRMGFPMAAEEVADALGTLDTVQVAKRWADLVDAGLIERTEERHTNRSGRSAFRYRAL